MRRKAIPQTGCERVMIMAMTPIEEARYAVSYGVDRKTLKPQAQAEYDRLLAERRMNPGSPPPKVDRLVETARTGPEVRARILGMFKTTNNKYAKPFDKDRLATFSVTGGNWEEYGQVVLQMAILDTLLSIEEKLSEITAIGQASQGG